MASGGQTGAGQRGCGLTERADGVHHDGRLFGCDQRGQLGLAGGHHDPALAAQRRRNCGEPVVVTSDENNFGAAGADQFRSDGTAALAGRAEDPDCLHSFTVQSASLIGQR